MIPLIFTSVALALSCVALIGALLMQQRVENQHRAITSSSGHYKWHCNKCSFATDSDEEMMNHWG